MTGIEEKWRERHARHARGHRDQRAHGGEQAAEQHRHAAVALEPADRLADVLVVEGQPAAVARGERAYPLLAQAPAGVVPWQRAQHRAERAGEHHQHRVELPLRRDEAGERHDQLRGKRWKDVLAQHQQHDAPIAVLGDDLGDPVEQGVLPAIRAGRSGTAGPACTTHELRIRRMRADGWMAPEQARELPPAPGQRCAVLLCGRTAWRAVLFLGDCAVPAKRSVAAPMPGNGGNDAQDRRYDSSCAGADPRGSARWGRAAAAGQVAA